MNVSEVFEAWMSNLQAFPVIGMAERYAAVYVFPLDVFATGSSDLGIVLVAIPAFELHWNSPVVREAGESECVVAGTAV
jgi:hypothetical protein